MLLTEKQKQKYMADTSAVAKLINIQKYIEVRNVRENKNEPYVLKDIFGSKGLLKIAANLNKDMDKIYKAANNIRKKSIAPKYLSREYFDQLLENKFITNHEHALIIGYEEKFKDLDKKIKELGKKIYKECKKKKLVLLGAATVGLGTAATIGMATAGAAVGGFLGACGTMLLLFPVAVVFPLSILIMGGIGAIIGAAIFGTYSIIGFAANIAPDEKDNAIIEDNKDKLVKEITSDLKKCQSQNLPGVPPHLLFVEDGNGNIGVPISHHLVAFEPQADIKKFHDMYQKVTEEFDNDLKTTNIGLFLKSSFDAKDIKRCLKMYKDHSKLVKTIVPMAEKLIEDLLKKHKNKTPVQDPKGWKESDKFVYYFAEYLSKLTYKGFNPEEIMQELKEKQSMQQAANKCDNIKRYMENLSQQPITPQINTTPVKAISIDNSKTKAVTLTPIQPSERGLSSDQQIAADIRAELNKELHKVFESNPNDFSSLKGAKCCS